MFFFSGIDLAFPVIGPRCYPENPGRSGDILDFGNREIYNKKVEKSK